jgi:glycosyltransferase involved in cell wall biosynthesis
MSLTKLTIIIPSLKQPSQQAFLQKATDSIRNQTIADQFLITVWVAVDKGCMLDPKISEMLGVKCVESQGASRAKALNAAIESVNDGFVAFLDDDDQWLPDFLNVAMRVIAKCDFLSSTQAEFDENNNFLRVFDFPTPSGWFMHSETLKKIGGFNEDYIHHQDNEWLGKLSEAKLKRIHLVEATAPLDPKYVGVVRPELMKVLTFSKGTCSLVRHSSPYPLVRRLVHSNSGTSHIATKPDHSEISRKEYQSLLKRFGVVPW